MTVPGHWAIIQADDVQVSWLHKSVKLHIHDQLFAELPPLSSPPVDHSNQSMDIGCITSPWSVTKISGPGDSICCPEGNTFTFGPFGAFGHHFWSLF